MLWVSEVFRVPLKSVAGVLSSCCNCDLASALHGSNYMANSWLWNGRSLWLQRYEQLIGCCWGIGSCSQVPVQLVSYVLNWVQIWGKKGPGQGVDVVGGQEGSGSSCCMGGSVVLQECSPGWPLGTWSAAVQCPERTAELSYCLALAQACSCQCCW
jgi:hypothetical protein